MYKVDIKYCPWAFIGNEESWEALKKDIPTEAEALAFADEVTAELPLTTVRITHAGDASYKYIHFTATKSQETI